MFWPLVWCRTDYSRRPWNVVFHSNFLIPKMPQSSSPEHSRGSKLGPVFLATLKDDILSLSCLSERHYPIMDGPWAHAWGGEQRRDWMVLHTSEEACVRLYHLWLIAVVWELESEWEKGKQKKNLYMITILYLFFIHLHSVPFILHRSLEDSGQKVEDTLDGVQSHCGAQLHTHYRLFKDHS